MPGDGAGRQPLGRVDHGRAGAWRRTTHRSRVQLLPGDPDDAWRDDGRIVEEPRGLVGRHRQLGADRGRLRRRVPRRDGGDPLVRRRGQPAWFPAVCLVSNRGWRRGADLADDEIGPKRTYLSGQICSNQTPRRNIWSKLVSIYDLLVDFCVTATLCLPKAAPNLSGRTTDQWRTTQCSNRSEEH